MAVTIGGPAEHGFDEPLGLMSDCHRRIERFLAVLARVVDDARGEPLSDAQRGAVAAALKYFRTAAPQHTRDEEESLFPRLRGVDQKDVQAALDCVTRLEREHQMAAAAHDKVDALYRQWLEQGPIGAERERELTEVLRQLQEIYREHLRLEDQELFPLAAKVLPAKTLAEVGAEMARRRGLEPPGAKQ